MRYLSSLSLVFIIVFAVTLSGCEGGGEKTSMQTEAGQHRIVAAQQRGEEKTAGDVNSFPEPGNGKTVQKPAVNEPPKTITEPETLEKPNLTVPKNVHDFGDIGPSTSSKCEFQFTNTGKGVLNIARLQSTCGCTVPQLKKKTYEPGETGTISVTFKAPASQGSIAKHIYIHSNDPGNPKYELEVKGNVVLDVAVKPDHMILSLVDENAGAKPVTITSKDGKEFSIKAINDSRKAVTADFDTSKKAAEFTITPKFDIAKLETYSHGRITFELTHPDTKQVFVSYSAPPRYDVSRPRIIMRNAEPGKSENHEVWVKSNYKQPVDIASMDSKNGNIEVVEKEKFDDNRVKLTVKVTPPDNEGDKRYFTDTLTIKLQSGENLTISCNGWYKRQ